jgi:hypothetical protein
MVIKECNASVSEAIVMRRDWHSDGALGVEKAQA